jgi:hypothetical protein
MKAEKEKESLCFDCKNAYAHKCVWIGLGRAVKGFKYDVVEYSGAKYSKTIVVRECPNFLCEGKKQNISGRNKLIIELSQTDGMTVRKIAAAAGVSEFTVQKVIKELGTSDRKRKCALCGNAFKAKGNVKYCGNKCRDEATYFSKYRKSKAGRVFVS